MRPSPPPCKPRRRCARRRSRSPKRTPTSSARASCSSTIPVARADPETIGRLLIPVRDGARVPLAQLADIRVVDGASIVARRENERQITVRTNIHGRDQGSFVADAQERLDRELPLPHGYRVTWGGQFEN